uniref:Uncharacterized protein n=1 Tax=Noctiluca scintillans TaxID=2966 RepID=A0A7S1F772_NOCSC
MRRADSRSADSRRPRRRRSRSWRSRSRSPRPSSRSCLRSGGRSPQRRSPLRSRSRRSRSVDGERPGNGDRPVAEELAEVTSDIVDGIPRSSGEKTWRAEVCVPRESGGGSLGKRGTTSIRGPNRITKDLAQDDIDSLTNAFKEGGTKAVRKCQQDLKRSWVK